MNVSTAPSKPVSYKPTISSQLQAILNNSPKILDNVEFGKIELEVRNGSIYRIMVSNSYLIKPDKDGN